MEEQQINEKKNGHHENGEIYEDVIYKPREIIL